MRPKAIPTACPVEMPPLSALPVALLAFEALLLSALSTSSVVDGMTVAMIVEGASRVVLESEAIDVEAEELRLVLLDDNGLLAAVSLVLLATAEDELDEDILVEEDVNAGEDVVAVEGAAASASERDCALPHCSPTDARKPRWSVPLHSAAMQAETCCSSLGDRQTQSSSLQSDGKKLSKHP